MTRAPTQSDASGVAARAVELGKIYGTGPTRVVALDTVSAAFPAGRFTAVMGPSGSGKSTLLHCLAALERPSSGQVLIGGTDISAMREQERTRLRRDRVGFVFQAFNLVPTLTAVENILLPLRLARREVDRAWLSQVVDAVGLSRRLGHRPAELSGGEQQRVAIARALVTRPAIVFADEPTGNLDSRSGAEVLSLLRHGVTQGAAVVMVTHDPTAAAHGDHVVFLAAGGFAEELPTPPARLALAGHSGLEPAPPARRAGGRA
jgi:putative ABC transport system ATP-binding protein